MSGAIFTWSEMRTGRPEARASATAMPGKFSWCETRTKPSQAASAPDHFASPWERAGPVDAGERCPSSAKLGWRFWPQLLGSGPAMTRVEVPGVGGERSERLPRAGRSPFLRSMRPRKRRKRLPRRSGAAVSLKASRSVFGAGAAAVLLPIATTIGAQCESQKLLPRSEVPLGCGGEEDALGAARNPVLRDQPIGPFFQRASGDRRA